MKNIDTSKKCMYCQESLSGRSDKIFCNVYCKSAFQYRLNTEKPDSLFKTIDKQLKTNRRILKAFNKSGKSTVRKEKLLQEGFNPKFFTHYYKTQGGNLYLFCYEYGFMEKTENNKKKFVLIEWQKYME